MAVYKETHPEHRVKNRSIIKETYYKEILDKEIGKLEVYSKMFDNDIKDFISGINKELLFSISYRSDRRILSAEYKDCLFKLRSLISSYVSFIEQLKNMSTKVGYATDALERFDVGQLTEQELSDELHKASMMR